MIWPSINHLEFTFNDDGRRHLRDQTWTNIFRSALLKDLLQDQSLNNLRSFEQEKAQHWAEPFLCSKACVPYIGGMMTVSITWITPFDAAISAVVTVASLTITLSPTEIVTSAPFTVAAVMPSDRSAAITDPGTTW